MSAVLGTVKRLGLARLAAVAVALALSGAGRLAVEASERGHHRCACPKGAHDCACASCLGAERLRERADRGAAPACHGAPVAKRAPEHRSAPGTRLPTLRGTCGDHGVGHVALSATDSFVAPPCAAPPPMGVTRALASGAPAPPSRSAPPPVPPPRVAPLVA